MKAEILKVVTKKVLMNILILLVIVFLVIAVTGIPLDFDIVSYNGKHTPNMNMDGVIENIRNNFKIFLRGEEFNIKVQGETIGQLLLKKAYLYYFLERF